MSRKLCESKWKQRTHDTHQQHLADLQTEEGQNTKILFLGSSMMERFHTTGKKFVEKYYKPQNVFIAGVGGDGIQHMLYRIEQGLLEACPPGLELIVFQGGTNNIEASSADEVYNGIVNLVEEIFKRRPNVKVAVFGLCLRDSTRKNLTTPDLLTRIEKLNTQLSLWQRENVFYFELNEELRDPITKLKDNRFFVDHVHFSMAGYGKFSKAIGNAIRTMQQASAPAAT